MPVILSDHGQILPYPEGIKAARRRLKLTTAQLGIKIGDAKHAIHNWEQGRREVPARVVYMLGEMLESDRRKVRTEKRP